jgi:hypothetical protein
MDGEYYYIESVYSKRNEMPPGSHPVQSEMYVVNVLRRIQSIYSFRTVHAVVNLEVAG